MGAQTRRTANSQWYEEDVLEIHPQDAEDRGIGTGDWAGITSRAGETALRAALRETREECGLELDAETLVDLGRLPYRARKDLHLFGARLPRLDPRTLHCDSRFTDGDSGQRWPEMDDFGWFPFAQVPQLCTRKLSAVLCERLDLAALLVQLQQRTEQALAA